jgi:hypothetical protein
MAAPTTKAITTAPVPFRVSDSHYRIDSFTHTLHAYDLHRTEHGWECSCPRFFYNRACKHCAALLDFLAAQTAPTFRPGDAAIWTPTRVARGVPTGSVRVTVKRVYTGSTSGNPDTALVEYRRGRDVYRHLANLAALKPAA